MTAARTRAGVGGAVGALVAVPTAGLALGNALLLLASSNRGSVPWLVVGLAGWIAGVVIMAWARRASVPAAARALTDGPSDAPIRVAHRLLCTRDVGSADRSAVLALAALAAGCATGAGIQTRSEATVTVADASASPPDDASPSALVMADAGRDAGPPDAGPPDAGPVDARVCVAETCNGRDDDCDGVIDDGAACPCPIRVLASGSYMFCATGRSWGDARTTCEGAGYHLVTIEDAIEDADVYAELDALGWGDTWIGLGDAAAEGTWIWSTGDPLAYEHWDEGEPNDGAGGEDCAVIMTSSGREAEWDDRGCAGARPHVCEPD